MEDSVSIKSYESITTSDEYEFVAKSGVVICNGVSTLTQKPVEQPVLDIANNGDMNDLCMQLKVLLTFLKQTCLKMISLIKCLFTQKS